MLAFRTVPRSCHAAMALDGAYPSPARATRTAAKGAESGTGQSAPSALPSPASYRPCRRRRPPRRAFLRVTYQRARTQQPSPSCRRCRFQVEVREGGPSDDIFLLLVGFHSHPDSHKASGGGDDRKCHVRLHGLPWSQRVSPALPATEGATALDSLLIAGHLGHVIEWIFLCFLIEAKGAFLDRDPEEDDGCASDLDRNARRVSRPQRHQYDASVKTCSVN